MNEYQCDVKIRLQALSHDAAGLIEGSRKLFENKLRWLEIWKSTNITMFGKQNETQTDIDDNDPVAKLNCESVHPTKNKKQKCNSKRKASKSNFCMSLDKSPTGYSNKEMDKVDSNVAETACKETGGTLEFKLKGGNNDTEARLSQDNDFVRTTNLKQSNADNYRTCLEERRAQPRNSLGAMKSDGNAKKTSLVQEIEDNCTSSLFPVQIGDETGTGTSLTRDGCYAVVVQNANINSSLLHTPNFHDLKAKDDEMNSVTFCSKSVPKIAEPDCSLGSMHENSHKSRSFKISDEQLTREEIDVRNSVMFRKLSIPSVPNTPKKPPKLHIAVCKYDLRCGKKYAIRSRDCESIDTTLVSHQRTPSIPKLVKYDIPSTNQGFGNKSNFEVPKPSSSIPNLENSTTNPTKLDKKESSSENISKLSTSSLLPKLNVENCKGGLKKPMVTSEMQRQKFRKKVSQSIRLENFIKSNKPKPKTVHHHLSTTQKATLEMAIKQDNKENVPRFTKNEKAGEVYSETPQRKGYVTDCKRTIFDENSPRNKEDRNRALKIIISNGKNGFEIKHPRQENDKNRVNRKFPTDHNLKNHSKAPKRKISTSQLPSRKGSDAKKPKTDPSLCLKKPFITPASDDLSCKLDKTFTIASVEAKSDKREERCVLSNHILSSTLSKNDKTFLVSENIVSSTPKCIEINKTFLANKRIVSSAPKRASMKSKRLSDDKPISAEQTNANETFIAYKTQKSTKLYDAVPEGNEASSSEESTIFTSYEISPLQDEDNDEALPLDITKPIPSWATGLRLKEALIKQTYDPPNLDILFGNVIQEMDLATIFNSTKPRIHHRSSSANWQDVSFI